MADGIAQIANITGNASVTEAGVLRLTKVVNGQPIFMSVGKAEYVAPVHIWEKEKVASFVTKFSFRMEAPPDKRVSDGLTFFLAKPNFPPGVKGGLLWLFNDNKCDSSYQIVAVEFDTHGAPENPYDPAYQHIGIDVNCVVSKKVVRWDAGYGGQVANVEIKYEASTKILTASLTYPSDKKRYTVSYPIDLKAILPEWVGVGFTANTADIWRETHDILNWSFTSTLKSKHNVALDNKARDTAFSGGFLSYLLVVS